MKLKQLFFQFLKYAVVGAIAFVADFLTMALVHKYLLPNWTLSLYAGVAAGFIVGSVVNYVLSGKLVFSGMESRTNSRVNEFLGYFLLGLIGLGLSELGMYVGTELLCWHYGFVKILVAGAVLVWNFLARRFLVYK